MLSTIEKQELVKKYGKNEHDTGSSAVQVAILTAEIKKLNEHNSTNIHDFSAKRSLVEKVAKRRSHLDYIKKHDLEAYADLIKELGLRR